MRDKLEIKMKKTFEGWLFNGVEALGNKKYNHIGCEGENEEFVEFLSQFVPEIGMRRKVKFTIETQEKPERLREYRESFNKNKNRNKNRNKRRNDKHK